MPAAKIAVPPDPEKVRRDRLARECAKLEKAAEQAAAEDFLASEVPWPEW